ncbi:hypothetical protein [Blastococcus sp. Marseille-P5729]|uniref:hypothetical protein n=1 Tax=Blastococcus sp. Marseille-P5729 TaxID=2086582 RepID=UPI00131C5A88|nr:hypothetical protein [Blastococcus sp. Marseille-P5729]
MTLQRGNPSFAVDERGITAEQLASFAHGDEEAEILDEEDEEYGDDELVRFSLRIPRWAKDKIDDRADREGVSTNAYLSELIVGHVARRRGRRDAGQGGRGFGPGGQGFGPGGRGGPESRPGDRGGPGFGGPAFGGQGFGPFGPGFLNPDVIGELGRMFADTFGDAGRDGRGPRHGGRNGRRGPGGRGRQDRDGRRDDRGGRQDDPPAGEPPQDDPSPTD